MLCKFIIKKYTKKYLQQAFEIARCKLRPEYNLYTSKLRELLTYNLI